MNNEDISLSRFRRLLQHNDSNEPGAIIDTLLEVLPPELSRQYRLCSIPHWCDRQRLRALNPTLDKEQIDNIFSDLASLSGIMDDNGRLIIHHSIRNRLFQQWLAPIKRSDFLTASSQLYLLCKDELDSMDNNAIFYDALKAECLFHLIGASKTSGFQEMIRLIGEKYRDLQLDYCNILLNITEEYKEVLSGGQVSVLQECREIIYRHQARFSGIFDSPLQDRSDFFSLFTIDEIDSSTNDDMISDVSQETINAADSLSSPSLRATPPRGGLVNYLTAIMQLSGTIGAAVCDMDTGMNLGQIGGDTLNLDVAAAGNAEVLRAEMRTINDLELNDEIDDILVTLGTQYHILRPLTGKATAGLFVYVALSKPTANLAFARHKIADLSYRLSF